VAISYHERDCFADARNDKKEQDCFITSVSRKDKDYFINSALVFMAYKTLLSLDEYYNIQSHLFFEWFFGINKVNKYL